MKHKPLKILFLCAAACLCVCLCACTVERGLDERFLPVALGVQSGDGDALRFTFGGYEPQKDDAPSAAYADIRVQSQSVVQAFEDSDLSYGMLSSLVVSCSLARDGLYPLYVPFIYNDNSSEGMYLCMSSDPSSLLAASPQQQGDVNDFLKDEQLHCPSILSYDIAMRTPGEACLVPVLRRAQDGDIELERAAVCCGETIAGYLDAPLLSYAHLLAGHSAEILVDFDVPDLDSGTVRVRVNRDVSLRESGGRFFYDVHLFGSGLVCARKQTHESIAQPSDSSQIAEVVNAALEQKCLEVVRIAQEEIGVDFFGFSRLALAAHRGELEQNAHALFSQNSTVSVQSSIAIQNLTQIH